MAEVQTLREGIIDPRHAGTAFYKPAQWLWKEVAPIMAPFQGASLGAQFGELIDKVVRVLLIALTPFVLVLAGIGCVYNLCAHLISPLMPFSQSIKDLENDYNSIFTREGLHGIREEGTRFELRINQLKKEAEFFKKDPETQLVIFNLTEIAAQFEKMRALTSFVQSIKNLENEYNLIFTQEGLEGIRGEKGIQFEQRISQLRADAELFKQNPEAKDAIGKLIKIDTQFKQIRDNRYEIINPPMQMTKEGVISSEDRGNCFYDTACKALPLYGCFDSLSKRSLEDSELNYRLNPTELRKKVVGWCRSNIDTDEYFRVLVEHAIGIYREDVTKEIVESQQTMSCIEGDTSAIQKEIKELEDKLVPFNETNKFNHYFQVAAIPGFWAGLPEFYALSKLYNVCIIIRRQINGIDVPEENCEKYNAEATGTHVKIWYDGRHFQNKIEAAS